MPEMYNAFSLELLLMVGIINAHSRESGKAPSKKKITNAFNGLTMWLNVFFKIDTGSDAVPYEVNFSF